MGGIYVNDPAPRNQALEVTGQPSLGSGLGLGAVAEESWIRSPFAPLRHQEQMEAAVGTEMPETGPVDQPIPPLFQDQPITPRANMLTPKEANDRFGLDGELSWDAPVRAAEAKLLNKWKREELKRQNVLSRATPGILPGAARLGVGFLVQAVDPLNVASAFIPIVREARFAQLSGRLGVTGARLTRGAAEGFVGAAVVEPLVYLQAQSEQADYDAYDSLLNLAFGTALGGGLHAGFGKISDWIKGQPIELRETALRGAVAAIAENRPVRVAEVLRTAPRVQPEIVPPAALRGIDPNSPLPPDLEAVLTPTGRLPKDTTRSLYYYIKQLGGVKDDGGDLAAMNVGKSRIGLINNRSGRSIDELGESMMQDGFDVRLDGDPDRWDVNKVKELIRREIAGEKIYALGEEGSMAAGRDRAMAAVESERERGIAIAANERARELLNRDITPDELRGVLSRFFGGKYDEVADAVTDELEQAVLRDVQAVEALMFGRSDDTPATLEELLADQRASYEATPDEAAQARAIDEMAEGWDQPITPEQGAEEAAELIEATNEMVQAAKKSGDLDDRDMATIEGDPEVEKMTKGRASAYQAAASCLARVA
jgi:hypothetical protein